jgi:diguanylate cyclase (GGDEF)-like protein
MQVLVAEDNPVFQSMLRSMLSRWGYEVVAAPDGAHAWRLLRSEAGPRLAILDWMMPGMDGPEVCRRVRALGREPYVYILLLTARTDSRDLVEGMDAGADDYVTKPFNAHELRVRLRAGRRILELQGELVRTREALRRQATRDGLTGVWNRTAILETLERELARADRENGALGVLLADLDHFKKVNDTYGHMAGDAVLREAARRMQAGLRRYDSLGRYGGEEFLVVLPGCDSCGAAARGERLREAVRSRAFSVPGAELTMTCSVGVSWTGTPQPQQAAALVRSADEALYRAKNAGRDGVEVSWPLEAAVMF